MAILKPFRALRPQAELASKIAAPPYDVMSSAEAKALAGADPYSFLRIDRAEINFAKPTDPHDPAVYLKAREILDEMVLKRQFIQDQADRYYIYRQIMDGRAQTGLVCTASIDDYRQDVIKKHEFTRPDKELDRITHIKALNAQTGPIFQTYRDRPQITAIIEDWTRRNQPVYQFQAQEVEQIVWVIHCPSVQSQLTSLFAQVDHLYIADGHHRSSAAVQVGLEKRAEQPKQAQSGEFNFFLSVLFPASDLKIWPYNRLVRDLAGNSTEQFLQLLQEDFQLNEAPSSPYEPEEKHRFGMYLAGSWYQLRPKEKILQNEDPVNSLDVAILQNHLLGPILKIEDPRTDQRIDFVGGIRGVRELERRVNGEMKVAFSLYPTSIEDVLTVADSNRVMPPKSTWFEPKLLSGLFIHKLD